MTVREGLIVGIDLGTTFSLVSVVLPGDPGARPMVLDNAVGEKLTPSVVALDQDGRLLVGAAAQAMATTHPDRVLRCFKREMGTDKTWELGGSRFTPQELSAMVIKSLVADAEAALGQEVGEAVVTVPAYFAGAQRRATRQAAELAGIPADRIINEPTAAAMAYGLHNLDKEQRAVVLDLGGGTFDVTVLEIIEGVVEVQASAGDARLGGEDFTEAMARLVAKRIDKEHHRDVTLHLPGWARLLEACERAKRRLSEVEHTRIALPRLPLARSVERDVELELTRADTEACWQPLLARIREPIWRALRDGGVSPRELDEVLLVGGATRMPAFIKEVAALCQRMPARHLPPDEAVAMGAAVQAALKRGHAAVEDMVVTDVAPFSLGVAVVLDLGGGTFDVTVLEIIEGVVEVQASAGDARLGGEDFTEAMARLVAKRIDKEHHRDVTLHLPGWARLLEACERAKRRLSEVEHTRIALPRLPLARSVERDVELELTRADTEACWQPLLARIREPIWRALRDGGVSPRELDEVLLVGGATRMPAFIKEVAALCQRMPARHLPPDEAVAMGAAVQAALKRGHAAVEDMVVTDVAPFSLGVAVVQAVGRQFLGGFFDPVLERGTVIPASKVKTFCTTHDGQTQMKIEVYEGEHSLVRENRQLGEFLLDGLDRAHAGQPVEVRFTYDLNGLLEVEMHVRHQDRTESLVIERTPGQLSPEEIVRAREQMAILKFHPRDALPNATALNRAEALYMELTGEARGIVGEAMAQFRLALESQDDAHIERARAMLLHTVEHFSGGEPER